MPSISLIAQVGVQSSDAAAVVDDHHPGASASHGSQPTCEIDAVAAARIGVPRPLAMSMPPWKWAQNRDAARRESRYSRRAGSDRPLVGQMKSVRRRRRLPDRLRPPGRPRQRPRTTDGKAMIGSTGQEQGHDSCTIGFGWDEPGRRSRMLSDQASNTAANAPRISTGPNGTADFRLRPAHDGISASRTTEKPMLATSRPKTSGAMPDMSRC